jgi:hypothetical protein
MGVGEDITDEIIWCVVEASTFTSMGFTLEFMIENGLQLQHDTALPIYFQHDKYLTKAFAFNQATKVELEADMRMSIIPTSCVSIGNLYRAR